MSTVTSPLDPKVSRLADQVNDLGQQTAESLHGAASSIRKGSKSMGNLAEDTAGKLDDAGRYLSQQDAKRLLAESRQVVARYPAESLMIAAGLGFLSGFAIRHLTHSCRRTAA